MPLTLVKRKGRPYWFVRGTVRGTKIYKSTGIRIADEDTAEAVKTQIEAEEIQRSVFGDRAVKTFAGAALEYMQSTGNTRYLKPIIKEIGRLKLADVTQEQVEKTARKLCKKNAAPATLNRHVFTPISAVLNHAGEYKRFRRPKSDNPRTNFLKPYEAEKLIDACSPHLKPLVTFLIGTGARAGEALKLQWEDVHLHERKVIFWNTKNGEMRGLDLSSRVVAALANLRHREGAVFRTHKGKEYAPKKAEGGGQFKTAFNGAARRAGIKGITPHSCRHTWATWYYSYTRDHIGLMTYGGWKKEEMVRRYVHLSSPVTGTEAVELGWAISVPYWEQTHSNYLTANEK